MSELSFIQLPYVKNPELRYQNFKDLPGFVLLESSSRVHGRYSILSAYPYDELKIMPGEATVSEAYDKFQQRLPIAPSTSDCPFQGGAIGYIAYDFVTRDYGLEYRPHPRLTHMPLLHMQWYDWAIIVDHQQCSTYIVVANRQSNTAKIAEEMRKLWLIEETKLITCQLTTEFQSLLTKTQYQDAFHCIKRDITRGRVYQVNYTQAFWAHYLGDAWEFYRKVQATNPVPFSAFLRTKDADLLSFSPERLVCIDNNKILTSPIKGTSKRSHSPKVDAQLRDALLSCSKNRAENVMIVDLLRNDLGKLAIPGSVQVTSLCKIMSFNAVHHLVSDIEAQISPDIHPLEVFAACFPGGSITGAPKLEAMKVINEQEPYARGVYCGSIGYFSQHGRIDTNIAIRTLTATDDFLYFAAGGGIVFDSQLDAEYQECFIKLSAIKKTISKIN